MTYLLFVLGFVILMTGASTLVDGAGSLGRKFGMSPVLIGFTIVALGTSLPELIINTFAAVRGETDLAVTNVLGSNIINTLFIIGAAAFIFPVVSDRKTTYTLLPASLFAGIVLIVLANFSVFPWSPEKTVSRWEGIGLLFLLAVYLYFSKRFGASDEQEEAEKMKVFGPGKSVLMILIGVAALYFGGNWVVEGAIAIASELGISQAVIGITIVAVATSLPELITSVIAAFRKSSGIALGNALGSNVFNVFLVLGVSSLIRPLPFSPVMNLDAGVMIFSNFIVLIFIYTGRGHRISKSEGLLLMFLYVAYLVALILR